MNKLLTRIANFFWSEIEHMPLSRQLVSVGDVITVLYASIASIIGLIWLVKVSDFALVQQEWSILLLFTVIIALFTYLNFFMIIEFRQDRYGSADGAFNSMAVWAAALIFGPTSLWIIVLLQSLQYAFGLIRNASKAARWNNLRSYLLSLAGFTLPYLIGLRAYEAVGGVYPIASLNPPDVMAAFWGILVNFLVLMIIWLPYFLYALATQRQLASSANIRPIIVFFFMALALPTLAHPFSILAAGLYSVNGLFSFNFFIIGLVVVAYLARQFSQISESHRQQSRQLEKLELLGRAILTAPPDVSTLPAILAEHVPNMFPSGNISIWMIPGQEMYRAPAEWEADLVNVWDWSYDATGSQVFTANDPLPWNSDNEPHRPVIFTPILAYEGHEVIGGIYLELRQLAQPWSYGSLQRLLPALHSLSDQVSSAIHQAEEYARSIALEKVSQEIQIAGQIQASFLPNQFPNIPGWQFAVTLEPAGGLSGDFFDLIPLSRGRLGLVIADVADKGLGAALYMALCRTLIRTYALEYHSRPDLVLSEANERILADARANLFITCFYGVLDPAEGSLIYCNAGHNAPIMITNESEPHLFSLARTGMPLGIEEEVSWERRVVNFSPGDKLILYTDGITDAQNQLGETFDESLLLRTIQTSATFSAFELQDQILQDVKQFMDLSPQFDDITLMILEREKD